MSTQTARQAAAEQTTTPVDTTAADEAAAAKVAAKTAARQAAKDAKAADKTARDEAKAAAKAEAAATKPPSGPAMMVAVLEAAGRPVHTSLIVGRVLAQDHPYKGKTPGATMSAQLATIHAKGGAFLRTEPGVYAVRSWPKSRLGKEADSPVKAATPTPPAVEAAPAE